MYSTKKSLSITKQVKRVGKKEFVTTVHDPKDGIFVIYIAFVINSELIYPSKRMQIALSRVDNLFLAILAKYADFINVFFPVLIAELL